MTYPNRSEKFRDESVYRPEDFLGWAMKSGWDPGVLPIGVVFTFQAFVTRHLREHPEQYVENRDLAPANAQVFMTVGDDPVAISCLNPGGATLATQMEHLMYLGDTGRFAVVGTAGGLGADLNIADPVLVTRALRDEGISHHYLAPGRFVDAPGGLTGHMRTALGERFDDVTERTTWTVPVPYRSTAGEIAAYVAEGVAVVEMEIASLFAVAEARGAEAAAAVVISDLPRPGSWEVEWRDTSGPVVLALEAAISAIGASHAAGVA